MSYYLTIGLVVLAVLAFVFAVSSMIRETDNASFWSYFGPHWIDLYHKAQRRHLFEVRIQDLTMGLTNALKAGMALPQALEKVGSQLGGVMGEEVANMLREYRLGIGISDAIDRLSERMPGEDMRLIASSVRLTTQTGGSLVDVMEQLTVMIRNRTEFQEKLKTLTAQGRFEAIAMASMPVVAFGLLYFLHPEMMLPLVTTAKGWCAIGCSIGLDIAGFLVIKKIVTIKV